MSKLQHINRRRTSALWRLSGIKENLFGIIQHEPITADEKQRLHKALDIILDTVHEWKSAKQVWHLLDIK